MRALHVYSGNLYGGIEAILATIARHARGPVAHDFALCFEGRLTGELRAAGAAVHNLPPVRLSRPHTARTARQALAGVLARERFDRVICHAPWSQAIFGGVARCAAAPLVFWAHDVMTGRHWTERLAGRVEPDLAIANSEFTRASLPRLYRAVSSTVVYAPVEMPASRQTAADRRALRASLDTPDGSIVIVQASRAEAWKGHALLIEALASLRDVPDWIWWQIGGAQRPAEVAFLREVREAAERHRVADRIRWIGQRDDVPRLLAAADVHCQANTSPEPFGIVFVEALAAGLPVVTTDLGGAREIVTPACGLLVAPEAGAIAGALRHLIGDADARARMAEAAPLRAHELSDPVRQIARLDAALESMAPIEVHA